MRVLLSRAVGLISRNRRKKERLTTRKSTESKDASGSRKWGKLLVSSVVFSTAVENSVENSWIRAEVFFIPFHYSPERVAVWMSGLRSSQPFKSVSTRRATTRGFARSYSRVATERC